MENLPSDSSRFFLLPTASCLLVSCAPVKSHRLMIIAGEPSGDAHAAALVTALRQADPAATFDFFGATGPTMRTAGVDSTIRSDDLAIMGVLEVGRVISKFWSAYKTLKQAALEKKPDAVILVDWPEFNLRLARSLHRNGIKVIYYISPQLWAWRSYRQRSISRDVDLLLSILPFEKQWYAERGIDHVEYIGHPLAGEVKARYDRAEFCQQHDLNPARPIVTLLSGSRHKEVVRILPPMLDGAAFVAQKQPEVQFVLVVAPSRGKKETEDIVANRNSTVPLPNTLRIVHHETREALSASNAAAIASGTATLEAALLGIPMAIVYKESAVNWNTLGRLINVDHFGLVNLVAGKRVVNELMQDDFTGENLAAELLSLLEEKRNQSVRKRLLEVSVKLGDRGASQRAAEHILAALN